MPIKWQLSVRGPAGAVQSAAGGRTRALEIRWEQGLSRGSVNILHPRVIRYASESRFILSVKKN